MGRIFDRTTLLHTRGRAAGRLSNGRQRTHKARGGVQSKLRDGTDRAASSSGPPRPRALSGWCLRTSSRCRFFISCAPQCAARVTRCAPQGPLCSRPSQRYVSRAQAESGVAHGCEQSGTHTGSAWSWQQGKRAVQRAAVHRRTAFAAPGPEPRTGMGACGATACTTHAHPRSVFPDPICLIGLST